MSTLILQFDTSTPVCTVALSRDGRTIGVSHAQGQNVHASRLTTQISELMEQHQLQYADLSAIAVGKGPGSYTGLRIGVSTAKGIAYAMDIPLIALDSLHLLAEGFQVQEKESPGVEILLCPMIDARRMEVYMSLYTADKIQVRPTVAEIIDVRFFDFLEERQEIYLFGSGADKFDLLFQNHPQVRVVAGVQVNAATISELAYQAYNQQDFVDIAYFEPFYLKDFIPTSPRKLG